jgi:HEAT repeat protein
MLDKAFEALKTYDFGPGRSALNPIDQQIAATAGDAAKQKEIETKVAAALDTEISLAAKQFCCRKLMQIGTAASVPTLAKLLPSDELSHSARYALERIQADEAANALRDALPKLKGELKVGVISSLGVRQDASSVAPLGALVSDKDVATARAAATALGAIRSADSAKALSASKPTDKAKSAVVDAKLSCAEALLAIGKKGEALLLYKSCASGEPPKHVKLAATRGMLACAGK